MEREQIIKALEYCTSGGDCYGCKYDNPRLSREGCKAEKRFDALSLIKELNEELERLSGAVKQYEEERKYHFEMSRTRTAEAKADTVRKMQERINAHFDSDSDYFRSSHGYIRDVVDQIAKEMLEDGHR